MGGGRVKYSERNEQARQRGLGAIWGFVTAGLPLAILLWIVLVVLAVCVIGITR